MEIQQKQRPYLHWGSVFAVLNAFTFFFYAYFKTSSIPCNSFGWLLLDHSELNQSTDNPTFLDSFYFLRPYPSRYVSPPILLKMNTFNEVNVIFS